jgi:hypothetical protein
MSFGMFVQSPRNNKRAPMSSTALQSLQAGSHAQDALNVTCLAQPRPIPCRPTRDARHVAHQSS